MNITGFDDNDIVTPTVDYIEEVPAQGNPVTAPELACIVCGTELTYQGRGPKPKYCADHKANKSSNSKPGTTRGVAAQVERAISELESIYRLASLGLRYLDDHAGATVHDKAAFLAQSWTAVLETNKAARDLFAKTEKTMAWLPVIVSHGDVAAAIFFNRLAEQHKLFSSSPTANGHNPEATVPVAEADYVPAGFSGDDV